MRLAPNGCGHIRVIVRPRRHLVLPVGVAYGLLVRRHRRGDILVKDQMRVDQLSLLVSSARWQ